MPYRGAEADQHPEFFADGRDQPERPRLRWLIASLIGLFVAGAFAGGVWFAYMQGAGNASIGNSSPDVPLIRADQRPTKVKPNRPGGMQIPDRDMLVFSEKRATVEHLLPRPEEPMARPVAAPAEAARPEPPQAPPAPAAAGAAAAAGVASGGDLQQQAAKQASNTPAKSASAQPSPGKPGGTRIQLGSLRSEDAARHEWDRIKRANADLLASVSARAVRADLGDKGVFYRIETAPIADAGHVCGELKQRHVGCIIAR